MAKSGPIIIIEDDIDDQEITSEVFKELGTPNKLIFFERCHNALDYLKTTPDQPFIIICDINLPEMSGLEFKVIIDNDPHLRQKSIPFIFMSTAASKSVVTDAYTKVCIQGFFQKSSSMAGIKEKLRFIVGYWGLCRHPNSDL